MTESSSTPDLDKEDSFTNLTDSQISLSQLSLLDESVGSTTGMSTPRSMCANNFVEELQKKLVKEMVKNALLQIKIEQTEEKNVCLEKEIKALIDDAKKTNETNNKKMDDMLLAMSQTKTDFNKRIDSLTFELEKFTNFSFKRVFFVLIANKWKGIDSDWNPCCENKCVKTNTPYNSCVKHNGFIQFKDDLTIKYNECIKGRGVNKLSFVYPVGQYFQPDCGINYCLYYYEIKCKKEEQKDYWLEIGVHVRGIFMRLRANESSIMYGAQVNEGDRFKIENYFYWGNEDIFGCGVIYQPKLMNGLPYTFFTQNGKQIGKALLLKEKASIFGNYEPYVSLKCCSIETNFGGNLEAKPFSFDIYNKFATDEFY